MSVCRVCGDSGTTRRQVSKKRRQDATGRLEDAKTKDAKPFFKKLATGPPESFFLNVILATWRLGVSQSLSGGLAASLGP
jgi:hypothetical protein